VTASFARFLAWRWRRKGAPRQEWDDLTQSLMLRILSEIGREHFDSLMVAIDRDGPLSVMASPAGESFRRALNTIESRAWRARWGAPAQLDDSADHAAEHGVIDHRDMGQCPSDLRDAIEYSLSPRELIAIRVDFGDESAASVAGRLGVKVCTVSLIRTKARAKIGEMLAAG
jgi:hypothetical protein